MSSPSEQLESQPKKLKSSMEDGEKEEACPTGASGAGDSAVQRSGDGQSHKLAISPVVQVHWLAECVLEADLVKAIAKFGTICYVKMMPSMRQALVEFENTEFSKLCVTSSKNDPIPLGGQPTLFNYSTSKKIPRPAKTETTSEGGSNVLLVSIYNAAYPVSVDILYSFFNPVGKVDRIVIFRRNAIKAMVEFETVLDAQRARAILNGTELFKGCGALNIEFARPTRLHVIRNNNDSWDYTISSMNQPDQGNEPQKQGFQGNQPPSQNQGNGPQRQGFQGNQPPFHNQGNGPQRQGFQGNQPPFQNQGNGPQRQGFQGNQPPFNNQGNGPQRQGFQGNQPPFYNQGNGPQMQGFQGNQPPFHNQGNGPQMQGFQGNQPPFHNQGNGPQRQGFQGNQPPFNNQGNGPQRQGFQGNQPPFHNQGNGPQRQGFQGNQPPFHNQGNGPQRQGFQGNQPPFNNQGNGPQMQGFQGNQPPFNNQGNGPQRPGFQGNQPPFPRFDGYDQGYGPQRQDFQGNQFNRFDGYRNHGPNYNSMGPGDNPEMMPYPFPQNAPPFMHGGPSGGLVAMIGGLNLDKMNCDRVFSLFCLYGNVEKVKFMMTIPGTAFVEMTEEFAVKRAVSFLNMVEIFGKTVSVCVSKQHSVFPSRIFQLRDGTSSYKEFTMSKLNRFTIATQPSKNLMQPPSCLVRYYNVPLSMTERDFEKLCEEQKVPKFIKFKKFDPRPPVKTSSGLLQWKTKTEAIEALIILNHYQIKVPYTLNPYTLKMSFSAH